MKMCIIEPTSLNKKIFLENGVELTTDVNDADYLLVRNSTKHLNLLNKTVYVSREPPTKGYIPYYEAFDDFKLVVAYNPDDGKKNQIPFNPVGFPNWVTTLSARPKYIPKKENSVLKTRGVFFAGNVTRDVSNLKLPKNAISIQNIRKPMVEYFLNKFPNSEAIGFGWNFQSRKSEIGWRTDKMMRIEKSSCDFILCLENTIYPNYMSEKFWDGLFSGKAMLYLGDPTVDNYFPKSCYIDLRPYYKNGEIDLHAVGDRLQTITQEEYENILYNASVEREKYIPDAPFYRDELTKKVLSILLEK